MTHYWLSKSPFVSVSSVFVAGSAAAHIIYGIIVILCWANFVFFVHMQHRCLSPKIGHWLLAGVPQIAKRIDRIRNVMRTWWYTNYCETIHSMQMEKCSSDICAKHRIYWHFDSAQMINAILFFFSFLRFYFLQYKMIPIGLVIRWSVCFEQQKKS